MQLHNPNIASEIDFASRILRTGQLYEGPVDNTTYRGGRAASYPEHIAKVHNEVTGRSGLKEIKSKARELDDESDYELKALSACAKTYQYIVDEDGQAMYKALYCGREWCVRCGQNGSIAHKRRIGRLWHRWHTFEVYGYDVYTIPPQLRPYIGKRELKKLATYIMRLMQRKGLAAGFLRWHFAGEDGVTWAPHLNVVTKQRFWEKNELGELKEAWARALMRITGKYSHTQKVLWLVHKRTGEVVYRFHKRTGEVLTKTERVPYEGQMHHSYFYSGAQATHKLKYIYRATYKGKDRSIWRVIYGFRNTRTWGKFPKPSEKSKLAALKELHGIDILLKNTRTCVKLNKKEFLDERINKKLSYLGLGIWVLPPLHGQNVTILGPPN
jgi:hypothetical protein